MRNDTLKTSPRYRIRFWLVALFILLVYIWSFSGIKFSGIKETAGQVSYAILKGLFNPDWKYVYIPEGMGFLQWLSEGEDLITKLIETLAISILGTFISAILCVPFAFWAANNMSRFKAVTASGKFMLSLIRTFPELVMAILFIKAVGPTPFAGVLALGLHSIGMLGKLYSEALENMDLGPTEALTACGANRLQVLWFAVIPQVLPEFLSFTLYRFEINVRSASILGMIGAGGIGTPLVFALEARGWSRVGIILLGIIVLVTIIDLISGYIRKRLV
ncbi:phosphonate ABC transporter, permease protein PhnE [Paenibacillus hamazuiensis]|uniref:phosphonate ABC transporter, permease protein PhnE n=1 Tax=Paenibacillus hamazuiensis TaxID=2936508 RepID=UPI00200D298F|nr:phosphonate ABC transporter, permease protein PhnE [Paenibacillus hamazuiensis]